MKRIIISENQFKRLMVLEANNDGAPTFDDTDIKEYPGSEVSATANITDIDGDMKYGDPTPTDKVQRSISPQSWWNSRNGSRVNFH